MMNLIVLWIKRKINLKIVKKINSKRGLMMVYLNFN